jgi:hypothetical protein
MRRKIILSIAAVAAWTGISTHAGIFDADFNEFTSVSNGFSLTLLGANGSMSVYVSNLTVSANGSISGTGERKDFEPGFTLNSTSSNVTFSGQLLSPSTSKTHEEVFMKRIAGRNVELKREVVSKVVGILAQFSDGGIVKGQWIYNLEREETAALRRGKLEKSWDNLDSWYSGNVYSWYQDKVGREDLR